MELVRKPPIFTIFIFSIVRSFLHGRDPQTTSKQNPIISSYYDNVVDHGLFDRWIRQTHLDILFPALPIPAKE